MRAIVYERYGSPDVLELLDVEKPTLRDDEVLIRVRASSVNPFDWHFMRGMPYIARIVSGLRKPKTTRIGVDVAGEVEDVGEKVTQFKRGDAVFGASRGALAEYACTSASALVTKPDNITFQEAGGVNVAAVTALQALRDAGKIQPAQSVLINGAAGGVGTFAVQIAKWFGADVTGVCSTRNVDLVRSLGADRVVDYTQEDFTRNTERYDLFLDCIGNHSLSASRRVLKPEGIYVIVGAPSRGWIAPLPRVLEAVILSRFGRQKFVMSMSKRNNDDLTTIRDLLESGRVKVIIDRIYTLRDAADAMRYLEEGHARGKVVIDISA